MIVVDEAHNLVDAVNAAHSASVEGAMAAAAAGQIDAYWGRFGTRLAPGEPRHNPNTLTVHPLLDWAGAVASSVITVAAEEADICFRGSVL